ncbi:Zinc finger FYVE domain-containing protein 1 [Cichlidogyrus casuarinus]|uniref:Zinc finger FYVE domain-containing protein 1 n=1 Tax=Cichlidogyrus casuarinus TaxID=1844966 RepID=A0ABD2Q299_9PLAT
MEDDFDNVNCIAGGMDDQHNLGEISQKKSSHSRRGKSKSSNQAPSSSSQSTEPSAVYLIDDREKIQFKDAIEFAKAVKCKPEQSVKVVSIVGKTGDGKSHTLNHAFFGGNQLFQTSNSQSSCTMGVWAAYVPDLDYLLLDTEGLLGGSTNPNQQKRLLLKLFAISDVVIYRTLAERLHSDIFTFLTDASDAFGSHFQAELQRILDKNHIADSTTQLGPSIIVYQETKNTEPYAVSGKLVAVKNQCQMDETLHESFSRLGRNTNSFSMLRYLGTRRSDEDTSDFKPLVRLVAELIKDNLRRSARRLDFVFKTLVELNRNFSTDLPAKDAFTFVEEYFTCPARCICCQKRCFLSLGHVAEGLDHRVSNADDKCVYEAAECTAEGRESLLVPKFLESADNAFTGVIRYMWSGSLLECSRHGVVYRSRANWSGNLQPERAEKVDWRVVHVWPGQQSLLKGTHPMGQIVLDGLNSVSSQFGRIAWPHARKLGDLITDSVAPEYWQPNSLITHCKVCQRAFAENSAEFVDDPNCAARGPSKEATQDDGFKHHCRACGQGVCSLCSASRIPVPEHGYFTENVRVCDTSSTVMPYSAGDPNASSGFGRKMLETFSATSCYIMPILQAPKEMVKTYARPDYWEPDDECINCPCCKSPFGPRRAIHHCRECGKGVCNGCSNSRAPVPMRGLDTPSRVCDMCRKPALK